MTQQDQSIISIHQDLKLPLCPAKPKMIQNRIILVEGIFDALNLWDKGLKNAVCCFGTQSVDWVKLSILKMQGATAVDIMFDGDEAGQLAATKVEGICETSRSWHIKQLN